MNILVIRFSSMGDCILATSLFSFLRQRFPESSITFITDSRYIELFENDSRLQSLIGMSGNSSESDLQKLNPDWDLVIDLQNNRRSRAIRSHLTDNTPSGAFKKLHLQRFFLLFTRINVYGRFDTVSSRYLQASGSQFTKEEIPEPHFDFSIGSRPYLKELLKCGSVIRPAIALFPFSAWKNKEWPVGYYAKVGRYYQANGWKVLIFGGPGDRTRSESLQTMIGASCISLAGKLSLNECGCILTQCSLALGGDTGLSHLARACGVKTGMIFGPTTVHFGFYPFGRPPFRVFERKFFCRPCHAHGGNVCLLGRGCLRPIKPDTVIRGLQELFHETRTSMDPVAAPRTTTPKSD